MTNLTSQTKALRLTAGLLIAFALAFFFYYGVNTINDPVFSIDFIPYHLAGRLVATGNTVIVIEHNLDVIKCADWIIDLGPEGGDRGGEVVATGTPEEVARTARSYTGQYVRRVLT